MSLKRRIVGWSALVLLALAMASPAEAATCGNYNGVAVSSHDYPGLTNHIAGCIRDTLATATGLYFDPNTGFYSLVQKAIAAVMTLTMTFFGGMAAFGMLEKAGRDTIMLALKIGAVSFFVTSSDWMYNNVIDMMDSTAQTVITFVPSNGPSDGTQGSDFSQIGCLTNMRDAQSSADTGANGDQRIVGPWLAMDCLLDSVVGVKVDKSTGNYTLTPDDNGTNKKLNSSDTGLSRGLLYLLFSAYQTSVFGVILAVIGFIFIWGMLNMIIRALFIYLAGYIGIAVMMIVSPLFIPLVLFQSTRGYFDKWVKLVISFALQPIIILIFVAMTIAAVDLATFSGKYSIMYRIAGDASQQQGFSLNKYLTDPHTASDGTQRGVIAPEMLEYARVKADLDKNMPTTDSAAGLFGKIQNSDCTKAAMDADPDLKKKCAQSYPLQISREKLDWDMLAQIRSPAVEIKGDAQTQAEQLSREVLASAMFVAIVVFIMGELLKVIPLVSYDLIGDFGQSPNLANVGGTVPGQQGIGAKMKSMVGGRS